MLEEVLGEYVEEVDWSMILEEDWSMILDEVSWVDCCWLEDYWEIISCWTNCWEDLSCTIDD